MGHFTHTGSKRQRGEGSSSQHAGEEEIAENSSDAGESPPTISSPGIPYPPFNGYIPEHMDALHERVNHHEREVHKDKKEMRSFRLEVKDLFKSMKKSLKGASPSAIDKAMCSVETN